MRKNEDNGNNKILELLALALGIPIINLVIWSVVVDTFFGFIRAIRSINLTVRH